MPISLSAKKSLRKSLKNNKANVAFKNNLKKIVKDFIASPSKEAFIKVTSVLDKSVKKGLNHKNKIARLKSRLSKMVPGKTAKKDAVAKTVTVKKSVAKKSAAKKATAKKTKAKNSAKKMS